MAARRLVCSIGTGNYSETRYALGGKEWATRFAPVAVARLAGLGGARASVLVTRAARERWYDALARELEEAGLTPEPIAIPDGSDADEVLAIFNTLIATVDEGDEVTLDVTFALRHLPFVYFTALVYLTAYKGIALKGIYYGAFEALGDLKPLIEITRLFELVRWYHAVQTFRDSGDLRPMARELRASAEKLFGAGARDHMLAEARTAVEKLAPLLAAGLPLESGMRARTVLRSLEVLERHAETSGTVTPELRTTALVGDVIRSFAIANDASTKEEIALTEAELRRQLRIARWYGERGDTPKALLLLREWLIDVALWGASSGTPHQWLQRKQRQPVEALLGALAKRIGKETLKGSVPRGVLPLVALWNDVADLRNGFAHAGMREEAVHPLDHERLAALFARAENILVQPPGGPLLPVDDRTLLVTPLGLSPGVIYSAVKKIGRERIAGLLVVTSEQSVARLDEALKEAEAEDLPRDVLRMDDPFAGYSETKRLIDTALRRTLVTTGNITINLTGGTTVMQYVVERIGDAARELGCRVRRIALVDRRPVEEQRASPYVLGDLIDLGAEARQDEDNA
jgi:hypothetical protein